MGTKLTSSSREGAFIRPKIHSLAYTTETPMAYLEAAWGVPTLPSTADQVIQFTFIDISTNFPCTINLIAWIANAPICSHQVLTCSILADTRCLCTLINICN
jgi:hypothetical protein